jgi:hypothetical protein
VIHFPPIRTRRLTIQLGELTIGDSVKLAAIPSQLDQASCTAFLNCAVQSVSGIEDLAQWTVQERMLAVAQYLAAVLDDGPDFSLGKGRYSDYLDGAVDIPPDNIYVGDAAGEMWHMAHLTGRMTESIERLQGELAGVEGRLHWYLGGMAAQLTCKSDVIPDLSTDGKYDEWLLNRMRTFAAFPESDFEQLMLCYYEGREKLHHLFAIEFSDEGIMVLSRKGADGSLPPARFRIRAGLSRLAFALGNGHA